MNRPKLATSKFHYKKCVVYQQMYCSKKSVGN